MIAIIMSCLYGIGFAALQVPAWAGLAALSGLLNVVPYVGTALGVVLATGFTFAHGAETWRVLSVPVVFTIVQCIEGYYLTPRSSAAVCLCTRWPSSWDFSSAAASSDSSASSSPSR